MNKLLSKYVTEDLLVTEAEYKVLMNLDDKITVPKNTLDEYNLFLVGTILLYDELIMNPKKLKFDMFYGNDNIKLSMYIENSSYAGFQNWCSPCGSCPKIKVNYYDTNRKSYTPFWTYTIFKDESRYASNLAYARCVNVLNNLDYKYSKFCVSIKFRDYSNTNPCPHPNNGIWLDGVEFNKPIFVINKGNMEQIGNWRYVSSIQNKSGIWLGHLPEPIKRLYVSLRK